MRYQLEGMLYHAGGICWPYCFVYVLDHLLERPISLLNYPVNGTGVEYIGRAMYRTIYRADGTGPVFSKSH